MVELVVITACPYSATGYTRELLYRLGLDVGHEKMFNDGMVSWQHCDHFRDDFLDTVKLHQIRHPLMVISQMAAIHNGYRHPRTKMHIRPKMNEMTRNMNCPDLTGIIGIEWAMNIWHHWNKFGIKQSDGWYTIESLPDRWNWFSDMTNIAGHDMPKVCRHLNRHTNRNIKAWDDLYAIDAVLTVNIARLATWMEYDLVPDAYLNDNFYNFPDVIISPEVQLVCTV